jgi:integrase
MPRTVSSKIIGTRTARRALTLSPKPVWCALSGGRSIGYRKNGGHRGGTWIARFKSGPFRREKKLAWADDAHDADGVNVLNYEQALESARKWFLEAVRESSGEIPTSGPYAVADACRDYLDSLLNRDSADYQSARYDLNANVVPRIGGLLLSKLTRPILEHWRSQLVSSRSRTAKKPKMKKGKPTEQLPPPNEDEKRRRKSTVNRTTRRLIACLNFAIEHGKAYGNPTAWKLKPFRNAESARPGFLNEDQQRALVRACTDPDLRSLIMAALLTGARYGELSRLRAKDFVSQGPSIYIEESKSGKSRHVFLDDEGASFFENLVASRRAEDILLLRSNGDPWGKDDVKRAMRRALKAANLVGIQFHSLRHSFATRLLMRGVSLQVVARQMGHASVRMLEKHYSHLTDTHVRDMLVAVPSIKLLDAATTDQKVIAIAKSA